MIGPNGSGKSTLIKCISKIHKPAEGSEITIKGKFLPIIEPWSLAEPMDSVENNIMLIGLIYGFKKEYILEKLSEILKFSELDQNKDYQFSSLSSGMKLRLIFSVVFVLETEIFFIDEFLSTGDESFRNRGFKLLNEKTSNSISIICSHERDTIKSFCNKILLLNNGEQLFFGDIEKGFEMYDKLLEKDK